MRARPTRARAVRRRAGRVTGAALAIPLLVLAACSSSGPSRPGASTTSARSDTIAYCGGQRQPRPTTINIICGVNDITAQKLVWAGWGAPVATARGTAVVDLCSFEDCHMGQYNPFPLVVVASGLKTCSGGGRGYSRLQYVFVGKSPFQGLPAHLNFKHYVVGSHRPGPPPHQTVSLDC